MKLVSKTILYYLLLSLPLLLLAGFISYHLITGMVRSNADEVIWKEKRDIETLIDHAGKGISGVTGIGWVAAIDTLGRKGYSFSDEYRMDEDSEMVNYRVLKSYYKSRDRNYEIVITKPMLEQEDLVQSLSAMLLCVIGFLVIAFFAMNWLLSKTLWKPFYRIIDALRDYDLRHRPGVEFGTSSTTEFAILSEALSAMTKKIEADYVRQKEFAENASHEMQTPLAVIKARLELLMQSPQLKKEEMDQVEVIGRSVDKLASLNKALALLTRIGNKQFPETSAISLQGAVKKTLDNYAELAASKNLNIGLEVIKDVTAIMNPALCDVFLGNILLNAIRHNLVNGSIAITISAGRLVVSNTGFPLQVPASGLFERFKKGDASSGSLGLGLSIVKSIADLYGFTVSYTYSGYLHTFEVEF